MSAMAHTAAQVSRSVDFCSTRLMLFIFFRLPLGRRLRRAQDHPRTSVLQLRLLQGSILRRVCRDPGEMHHSQ